MTEAFLKVINMSISAAWMVLAVLAARLILARAPRWIHVVLWGIVAVRLMCPISIESVLSLIPSAQVISPDIMMDPTPQITTGIPAINAAVNPIISESFAPNPMASANPLQIWIPVTAVVWAAGMAVMACYTVFSYFRLHRKVRTATRLYGNIFQSARIPSPFVLGIVKPRIYLPYGIAEADMAHVIAHEQTHIRRRDHWWKPLGFTLLTLHWFNPFVWLAYILLCRDIELACDEKVVKELGRDQRADYSQALLACSVDRPMIAACPLAFGEVGVKARVKNVLHYQKPAFWVIVLAVILCAAVAVCFLTDPEPGRAFAMNGHHAADLDPGKITGAIADMEGLDDGSRLYINTSNFSLHLTDSFEWDDAQAIRFFYFKDHQQYGAQLRIFPEENRFFVTNPEQIPEETQLYLFLHYLQALKYLPQDAIRSMCPGADGYIITQRAGGSPADYDRALTYSPNGTVAAGSWLIHLELQPLHSQEGHQTGSGQDAIHLFYRDSGAVADGGTMEWFDFSPTDAFESPIRLEKKHPAFPGVTFRCNGGEIIAEDSNGERVLITGMPIWNACFTDLSGDGIPEICATVSFGSGLVDTHVVVYDYGNGQEYTLWERGIYDYALRAEGETLLCDQFVYASGGPVDKGTLTATGQLILTEAGGGAGKRLLLAEAEEKPPVIVPSDTNLRGLHAEYLFVPIDGATYRYALTTPNPWPVTADRLLDSFTDASGTTEVYSLAEYPDLSKVLLTGGSTPWLCEYAPARRAEEGALEAARKAGYVIVENEDLTGNRDLWLDFYEATQRGEPAFVRIAHSHTLDPDRTAADTYEAYRQDYPALYLHELSLDGNEYILRTSEDVRTYAYLMKYTASGTPLAGSSDHKQVTRYVLTLDNTHTYEELWKSLVSSALDAAIPHFTICSETN